MTTNRAILTSYCYCQKCLCYISTIVFAVAVITLCTFSVSIFAQPDEGWTIRLEPMHMAVFGNDKTSADLVTRDFPFANVEEVSSSSVDPDLDSGPALRGEARYKSKKWGVWLNGWWFDTDGSESGGPIISGPPPIITPVRELLLWDTTLLAPAPPSPGTSFQFRNELKIWNADFLGTRTLGESMDTQIELMFGLKTGSLDNTMTETVNNGLLDASGILFFEPGNARQKSKADYDVVLGPAIGLLVHTARGKHNLESYFNQALVIGQIKQNSSFRFDPLFPGSSTSVSHTFNNTKTESVPVTELKLTYAYSVTKTLSLGLGIFASIWWDAALAPEYSFERRAWKSRDETLSFVGGLVSVSYTFF